MNWSRCSRLPALVLALALAAPARARAQETTTAAGGGSLAQLVPFVAIGVIALVAVFGGLYYWRYRNRDDYDKLR